MVVDEYHIHVFMIFSRISCD